METLSAWITEAGGGLHDHGRPQRLWHGRILQKRRSSRCCRSRWSCGASIANYRWRSSWRSIAAAAWRCPSPADGRKWNWPTGHVRSAEPTFGRRPIRLPGRRFDRPRNRSLVRSLHEVGDGSQDSQDRLHGRRHFHLRSAGKGGRDDLARATAGTRHIILFADAADSEEPGDYRDLVDKMR